MRRRRHCTIIIMINNVIVIGSIERKYISWHTALLNHCVMSSISILAFLYCAPLPPLSPTLYEDVLALNELYFTLCMCALCDNYYDYDFAEYFHYEIHNMRPF